MRNLILLSLFLPILIVSCEQKEEIISDNSDFIGIWTNPIFSDSISSYKRTNSLPDDNAAIQFKPGGVFLNKANAGWCGTPPITYATYEGNWTISNDSVLTINVPYWGGEIHYKWKIERIVDDTLTLIRREEKYIDPQF